MDPHHGVTLGELAHSANGTWSGTSRDAHTLDDVDALAALHHFGTVSEAATWLRLTQSAVSKRLQSIQRAVGFNILERDGRRIRLTEQAVHFLERTRPVVAELRALTKTVDSRPRQGFSIAMSESIAASWGPAIVQSARRTLRQPPIAIHVEPGALAIETVRLGRYDMALCTSLDEEGDLASYPIVDEPMILVHSLLRTAYDDHAPLISIEPTSATSIAIESALNESYPTLPDVERIHVDSFTMLLQMVKAGFGNGLLPLGHAKPMNLDARCFRRLAVTRPVRLHTRPSLYELPGVDALRRHLAAAAMAEML